MGNLKKKSDYSENQNNAYTYVPGTNKLQSVALKNGTDTVTYGYDSKGNQTTRNGIQEVTYNVFNKPTFIDKNNSEVRLSYGADLARYKQVRTENANGPETTTTTYYIGKHYEVEITDTTTTRKHYISDVAIVSLPDTALAEIVYTHRDRLGSAVTMTDDHNQVVAERHFDPFGKPRKGKNWSLLESMGISATLANNEDDKVMATRRGFTDHEHLDQAELIHMNGRVYDYNVGRFMSVDPVIQSPGNSQSINPYSYVMNNPLAMVDPTGYSGEAPESDNIQTKTVMVSKAGSRIKSKVTVTVEKTEDGAVFTISGSNGAAVSAVGDAITGNLVSATDAKAVDIGSNQKIQKQKSTNRSGFSVSNPNLSKVQQNNLSREEKGQRLEQLDQFTVDSSRLPQHLRETESMKIWHYLRNILLTDEGAALMEGYKGKGINIVLCEGCESARSFDKNTLEDKIQINIHEKDFETAEGTNTFVQLSGMRTMTHEFVHAAANQFILDSLSQKNEIEAVQKTNIIMKQHFQRIGMPELAGARNWYGKARRKLPLNATLKEKWGDGHEH